MQGVYGNSKFLTATVPQQTTALTRIFFPHGSKSQQLFQLLSRVLVTHSSVCYPPFLTYPRIETSLLAISIVIRYLPRSPRPEVRQSTLILLFPTIRTRCYRPSPIGHQATGVQTPDIRGVEMSISRPHSLTASPLASSNANHLNSRGPSHRYPSITSSSSRALATRRKNCLDFNSRDPMSRDRLPHHHSCGPRDL
jgi:hypothetical protein